MEKYTEKDWENEVRQQIGIPDNVDFDKWLHSGETAVCMDCGKTFYRKSCTIEDCPVRGMAHSHRVKGEKYVPWW